jgi:hypothetical protein
MKRTYRTLGAPTSGNRARSSDQGLLPLVDAADDSHCALDIGRHDGSEVAGRLLVVQQGEPASDRPERLALSPTARRPAPPW